MRTLILIMAAASFQLAAYSQTVRVTNITGRAPVTGDVSPNQARKEALDDAKLNALKSAGIEEKISCYQSLNTDQVNDDNNQSFQSHIQSDILGAVKFDTVISEGMVTDSDSHVYYQVCINAEVTPYVPQPETTVKVITREEVQPQTQSPPAKTNFSYNNGDSYSGQFANGGRNGYGTYRWANGSQYTGYYKNGMRDGPGVYYGSNGKVMTGIWTNGIFTKYQSFAGSQGSYTSSAGSYGTGSQNTNGTVTEPSPQDKLSNDQSNFAHDVDTQEQKIQ
ncbi:MAG TPA: hypothetical protein VK808_00850 [Bacteroidia bacterium]|jgi:hypothetical protein|nr:hypothetical protein [Bacteroidia bacterium]